MVNDGCTDKRRVSLSIPTGGDVIYAVAHQHAGGIGSALYGEVLIINFNILSVVNHLCYNLFIFFIARHVIDSLSTFGFLLLMIFYDY